MTEYLVHHYLVLRRRVLADDLLGVPIPHLVLVADHVGLAIYNLHTDGVG